MPSEKQRVLQNLKMETASQLGLLQNISENKAFYKGDVAARINGAQGGPIGGQMVRKMIRAEENRMAGM
jgi:hypothetical protein